MESDSQWMGLCRQSVFPPVATGYPETRILLRGDAHFANVELMQLALDDPYTDFLFGLAGNSRLKKLAEPHLQSTRRLHDTRCHNARLAEQAPPQRSRTFHEIDYQARSWPQAFRTVLKAETMALGDIPRFVVTSLEESTPEILYAELYCARGQDENFIKMMKKRPGQRPHLGLPLCGQPPAPVFLLRRLCTASRLARRTVARHRVVSGPALDGHHQAVQAGRTGGAVQRPHQAPPAR